MRAVRFETTGGPEVLQVVDIETPEPGAGQVRVRHEAIGVNFIDTYHRSGLYPVKLPCIPGGEAAGVVDAVGEGVTRLKAGDRVAYSGGFGAYAEANVVAADRAVKIPDGVETRVAAASLLKGMTVEAFVRRAYPVKAGETVLVHAAAGGVGQIMTQWLKAIGAEVIATVGSEAKAQRVAAASLLKGMTVEAFVRRTYPVKAGETVLVHAAAGGVGQIMTQWLKAIGAEVIATVGSEAKAQRVRELGADHVILYRQQDVAAEVRRITGGKGVPVAYDSVGKDTFEGTLGSLARRGLFVSFGNASGPVPPFPPSRLAQGGSLYLTRPTLFDYIATPEDLAESAGALLEMIRTRKVQIEIGQTFPLAEARSAHEALHDRSTVGASLLIP